MIVDVNSLTGVVPGPQAFAWLREHHEPIDHLGYSWLVYEIPQNPGEREGAR